MRKTKFEFSWSTSIALPIACFVVIGFLFSLADITTYAQLKEQFTPFSAAYSVSALTYDETQVYVPGARRFFETNSAKTEVDVFELRQTVGVWPITHSVIIGSIAKLIGNLEASWVIAHAVFPASVWLLLFLCARKLLPTIPSAVLLASATCLVPFGLRNFLLIGQDAFIQPLELSRIPHPGMSFTIMLLGQLAISRAVTVNSTVAALAAGVLIGLNFYSYYFYCMTTGLGLGAWLFAAAALRRWNDVKVLSVVGITAVVVGLPFFATVAIAGRSDELTNFMGRFGVFHRDLSVTYLFVAVLLTSAAIFVYTRARVPPIATALVFALAGASLGLNVHLLTGYDANDYHHFVKMCATPLFFFLLGAILLNCLPTFTQWSHMCIVTAILLFAAGAYRQVCVGNNTIEGHDQTKNSVEQVTLLRDRIAGGSVVGNSDPQIITLLPAISTLWTFVPLGSRSHASNYRDSTPVSDNTET